MTKLQRAQLAISKSRAAINELQAKQDRTEAENAQLVELRTKHQELEQALQTALEADPGPERRETQVDNEQRELDRLVSGASIADVVQASLSQRATDGATSEMQQHFGLNPNQIAIEQLRPEVRAVTPAPAQVGQIQNPIVPQIFPDSVLDFLGIGMPVVPVGDATYTIVSAGAAVGTPAKGASQPESTGGFSANVLSPKRAQASFFWNIEDEARLRGMDAALRQNLGQALSAKFSDIALNDVGDGLLGGGLTAPADPSGADDFDSFQSLVVGRVDGLYAATPDQVRFIIGADCYQYAERQFRSPSSAGGVNESSYERWTRKSGGVRVSSHVAAMDGTSKVQDLVAVRRPEATHAVLPIWRGVTLIPDRITKAASGQVVLTAVSLWALKVVRSDGFARLKVKLG